MKFKEYNQIIKDYEAMAVKALKEGNEYAANCCQAIAKDLEKLKKQGALSLFPRKDK